MNASNAGRLLDHRPAFDVRPEWVVIGLAVGFLVALLWPSDWKQDPHGW